MMQQRRKTRLTSSKQSVWRRGSINGSVVLRSGPWTGEETRDFVFQFLCLPSSRDSAPAGRGQDDVTQRSAVASEFSARKYSGPRS